MLHIILRSFNTLLLLMLITLTRSVLFAASSQAIAEQWQLIDLSFEAPVWEENPYIVDFTAKFTNSTGKELQLPGFYNGDKEWLLRFSSADTGTWSYVTHSEYPALDGKKGSIRIVPNTLPGRHGAVIIPDDNPQHFYYEDGTPYMQMAFECDWLFALDYHNRQGLPKTNHLLDLLQENNLNQIVTTLYSFDVNWDKDPRLAEHPEHEYGGDLTIYPFMGTNVEPDFSRLNVEFFQKFDRVMTAMHERNITAHLMLYVWNKLVSWPEADSEADNMYFDYIIKRYQAFPNIIWDVSKEALNNKRCSEAYGLERIERIRRLDAYDRLVSVHDYGFCSRNHEVVDFISVQSWSSSIYSFMNNTRTSFPNKPIFNIEHGGYELSPYTVFPGDFIDPDVCLRRNYQIQFAGVYSTYYWQGASWNAIIHNPLEQPVDFVKPRFDYYKHMVDFFEKYNFHNLQPTQQCNHSGYCMSQGDSLFLVYVPKENYQFTAYYNSSIYSDGGTCQWFNTLTGEYSEEESCGGFTAVNPWFRQADAVLIRRH